jgi:hypothetical protein
MASTRGDRGWRPTLALTDTTWLLPGVQINAGPDV